MTIPGPLLAILLALVSFAPAPAQAAPADTRPILQRQRGVAYAWSLPPGWRVQENANAVDLAAPDGLTGVSASFVLGMFGQQTPEGHLRQVLGTVPLSNVQFLSTNPLPPAPGPMGLTWRGVEVEFRATSRGRPVRVRAISHVLQGAGQYIALVSAMQGPEAQWESLRQWLPRVRDSLAVVDASVAGGAFAKGLPRGIRHDEVYGRYNQGWTARGLSRDRLSAAQREGTMGYTRQKDPATNRIYDMPLEAYDATRGGYVNPRRPTELLVPTLD